MTERKKIVLIAPKDNNFFNFRRELILTLIKQRFEVVLVCPYGKKIDFFINQGCRFIEIEIDRRGTSINNDIKLISRYKKMLVNEKPDLVLTYTTKCSVYGGLVCGWLRIPYIVNNAGLIESENNKSVLQKILYFLYKTGFRKASCMMYQNSREGDVMNSLLKGKIHYRNIPGSGVNLSEFSYRDYPRTDDTIVFNYVARIVKIKGIDEFLECAKIIKGLYPNTQFCIYGDFDDDVYREKVSYYEKQQIVSYEGVKLDMKPYIEKAHAVIHPSYYEGMTNVVLEHSAMGRPCLGSDIPGVREGINDKETGFLFNVRDVSSMVEAVKCFLQLSHEQKMEMGRMARIKMEKEFNRDIVTETYLEEIGRIIN